jgi:hypothetical protein
MASYYGLMIDAAGTVRDIQALDCADHFAAVETARAALLQSPDYESAEVWRHGTRLGKVVRPSY